MTKKSEQEDEFVFQGTLMEGPKIDLIELSGIQLTEEEEEKLWGEWNERNLLMETGVVAEIELYEVDEIPGQSDVWYEYRCSSKTELIAELRELILSVLNRNFSRNSNSK